MLSITTLRDIKDNDYYLWASCVTSERCSHFADLDIDMLIERFGADLPFVDNPVIAHSLRCAKCGGRKIEIRLGVRAVPKPGPGNGGQ